MNGPMNVQGQGKLPVSNPESTFGTKVAAGFSTRRARSDNYWKAQIHAVASARCELDVLLRDEWRHRVVFRDDGTPRATVEIARIIDTGDHVAREKSDTQNKLALRGLSLATLHVALAAFGQGSTTVVAVVDQATGSVDNESWRVSPSLIDHGEHELDSCAAFSAALEVALDQDRSMCIRQIFGHGLFDVALVFADAGLPISAMPPLSLTIVPHDEDKQGGLRCSMKYPGELLDAAVVNSFLDVLQFIFNQFLMQPTRSIKDIGLLPENQRQRFAEWNRTCGDFPENWRLEQLFEDCVRRHPDAEAVVFQDERLSYTQLNNSANQLAHLLMTHEVGVVPGDFVGICLDKGFGGVMAELAIWKSGAAYVPIDPAYPDNRIRQVIADTRPRAIIVAARHEARLRATLADVDSQAVLVVAASVLAPFGAIAGMPRSNPSLPLDSTGLAYISYTSGTTGIPKGVTRQHHSVVNSITDLSQRYAMLQPGCERVALFASYAFEPHLRQTLLALLNGQTLIIIPDDIRLDPDLLPDCLAEHGVTFLNATASVIQHFDLGRSVHLHTLALVGEELTAARLRQLRKTFKGRIINEYAFTEAAFVTAIKVFGPGCSERADRSIGRPLRNVRWYVLNQRQKQLPIGAIGELYVGGRGVGRGYHQQHELTRSCFFPDTLGEDSSEASDVRCLYRTGDLARFLSNGEVEFLGRSDFQLKMNGIRVEPGEIESLVAAHLQIHSCVVVQQAVTERENDRCLVGYFVVEQGADLSESDLLTFLKERLIQPLVPARMVRLERMPVTINGKIDRAALPWPIPEADSSTERVQDYLSKTLREIWADVLGVQITDIADDDDFFKRGGHSISCIFLVARIRQRLHRFVSVEKVFALHTFGCLLEHLIKCPAGRDSHEDESYPAASSDSDCLFANGLQQSLIYHAMKREAHDDAYVVQSVYTYHAAIDAETMKQSWLHAHRQFPGLRLRFSQSGEYANVLQQVIRYDDSGFDWRYVDASHVLLEDDRRALLSRLLAEDRDEPYEPLEGGLYRVYMIAYSAQRTTVIFSCHHLVIDGWSLPVLHHAVHKAYLDRVESSATTPQLDTAYLAAQRYWQTHRHDQVDYWTAEIAGIGERGDYGGLLDRRVRGRVSLATYDRVVRRGAKTLNLGPDLTARLKAASVARHVTLHSILQFVWHEVLHAFGNGRSTVVGTVVSGRELPLAGIESSVGLYINTLPLVIDHGARNKRLVSTSIAEIQTAVNRMSARSVVDVGSLRANTLKRELFDTLLVFESHPSLLDSAEEARHEALLRYERDYDADRVDHPLAVVGRVQDGELQVTIWYASEIMDAGAVNWLLQTTELLFEQIADDMDRPISTLQLLSPRALEQLDHWNQTVTDFPADATLSKLFEIQVTEWPDATAVVYAERSLSYRTLNDIANRIARCLLSVSQLSPDDLVAIVMDKSEFMIASILAVWKAGAAWVPIDPAFPDDRITFMLADTDARIVLADKQQLARLRQLVVDSTRPVLSIEELNIGRASSANLSTNTQSTHLAYAIYTSGTTGQPKAVLVEHRGVVNLHASLTRRFGLDKRNGDVALLSFSELIFDHFVEVLSDALLNGQKLVLLDNRLRGNSRALSECINRHRVTYLSGTPSVLSMHDLSETTTLRYVDAIGEKLTRAVFDKIQASVPNATIINGYGPTEISITSHKRSYLPTESRTDQSIGHPVANTVCYVLNEAMQLLPLGGIGELYIGGAGVARGYLNRDDLTTKRFIANPFQKANERHKGRNARLYRTGDLVRWLDNGELEYLGRVDQQVKIRGQRIEPSEIETVLAACPGVEQAVVVARTHSATAATVAEEKYLVGFYLGQRDLDERELRQKMRQRLPDSLVPARFVRLSKLPIGASGKLEWRELPDVEVFSSASTVALPPRSEKEMHLRTIWSQVLGLDIETIGVDTDFFALGGDSLRVMSLAQMVGKSFELSVDVARIFQYTTISSQAQWLAEAEAQARTPMLQTMPVAPLSHEEPEVSHAQERLLFIDEFEGGTTAFNVPFALLVKNYSPVQISAALCVLLRRHDSLRTLLRPGNDGIYRQYRLSEEQAEAYFDMAVHAVKDQSMLDRLLVEREGHRFVLAHQLPWSAQVFEVTTMPEQLIVSLVFHHSCIDGWSWKILRHEFAILLGGGSEQTLPPLRASYVDFAREQRRRLVGRRRRELIDFWRKSLANFEPVRLPLDHPRPAHFDYTGRRLAFRLDSDTTAGIHALASSASVSVFSVLLSAWCLTLHAVTGQRDLVLGTPIANRDRTEYAGLVGLVANLLAIRVRVDPELAFSDYLSDVGHRVRAAQVHAELPFELLVKAFDVERDLSSHPIVRVSIGWLPDQGATKESLMEYTPRDATDTSVKFDLSAMLCTDKSGIAGTMTYARTLFDEETVRDIADSYVDVLRKFAIASTTTDRVQVAHFQQSTHPSRGGEKKRRTSKPVAGQLPPTTPGRAGPDSSLVELFERAVDAGPDKIAVACNGVQLSYRELNARANRLARHLRASTTLRGRDLIALVIDRSEWMIVAILAVWKAGAGYLPIDPRYPDKRIAFMLEDTNARLLLGSEQHCARLASLSGDATPTVIAVEATSCDTYSAENLGIRSTRLDLAYSIYTSGTTGQPKAVLTTQRNVQSFHQSIGNYFEAEMPGSHESVLMLSNYVFDFSVEQLSLSVLSGNKLVIPPECLDHAAQSTLAGEGITYISGTPTQIHQLDLADFEQLQAVLVAGEPFYRHHLDGIRKGFRGTVFNAYGTTETTVYNTVRRIDTDEAYCGDLGQPLENTRVLVLDVSLQPVTRGTVGEIYMAGDCVTDGYLNRLDLTIQRFIPNSLQSEDEQREGQHDILYRTGDLVSIGDGGELHFLGRVDTQLKIHGVRIEPGELEAAMMAVNGVRTCAVLAYIEPESQGKEELIACYVPDDTKTVDEDTMLASLRRLLPPTIIPQLLVRVEGQLPMTLTGKIDACELVRRANACSAVPYVAPRGRREEELCRLWAAQLPIECIGIDHDFFRSGGDSIAALRLSSQVESVIGLPISVRHIFDFPTVRSYLQNIDNDAAVIGCATRTSATLQQNADASGLVPLLPIQRWFFSKPFANRARWNQCFTITTPELELDRLQAALELLVESHDAFCLRFREKHGCPEQFFSGDHCPVVLHELDVRELHPTDVERSFSNWQDKFDLETGPTWCVAYLHGFSSRTAQIRFAMHHLIVDVVSWGIVLRDLEILYNGGILRAGHCGYRLWAERLACHEPGREERAFWKDVAQSVHAYNQFEDLSVACEAIRLRHELHLSEHETRTLFLETTRLYDADVDELLLTATGKALQAITGRRINFMTVERHGRESLDNMPEFRDTIGWFTTMYPLRLEVGVDLGDSIRLTRQFKHRIPRNGLGYGTMNGTYGDEAAPLPPVTFNYLGRLDSSCVPSSAWRLDTGDQGAVATLDGELASDSALDVTMFCTDGRLIVTVDSRLSEKRTQAFIDALADCFHELVPSSSDDHSSVSPSCRALIQTSCNGCHGGEFIPYHLVDTAAPAKTLFLLPPGEGGAESYLGNLAGRLSGHRLVLFNNIHRQSARKTFESLADYYLEHVRKIQPVGPYVLLGWSFGGVLAFEMSLRLARAGEQIGGLLLIDPYFDVNRAVNGIGMPPGHALLDPINHCYQPDRAEIDRFASRVNSIVLFKACRPNDRVTCERQRQLFEYYRNSAFNNLDSYIDSERIRVEPLYDQSHHSWVGYETALKRMSLIVNDVMEVS